MMYRFNFLKNNLVIPYKEPITGPNEHGISDPVIGLDLGEQDITLVELESKEEKIRLIHLDSCRIPENAFFESTILDEQALIDSIRRLTGALKSTQRRTAIALKGHQVIMRTAELPLEALEEEDELLWLEAEQYIPFERESIHINVHALGSGNLEKRSQAVMFAAVKKTIVNELSRIVEQAGLISEIVDIDTLAAAHAVFFNYPEVPLKGTAILDIGINRTSAVIFNPESLYIRDIGSGCALESEIFIQDLSKFFNVYARFSKHPPVERILFNSAEGNREELKQKISGELGIKADFIQPFTKITIEKDRFPEPFLDNVTAGSMTAVGLALRMLV